MSAKAASKTWAQAAHEHYTARELEMAETSLATVQSLLLGPQEKRTRKPKNPLSQALAQSALGDRPIRRTETAELRAWFAERVPSSLAKDTRRRNMSLFKTFLEWVIAEGYGPPRLLNATVSGLEHGDQDRRWFRPEQYQALKHVLVANPVFDDWRCFAVCLLADTGVRPAEARSLKPGALRRGAKGTWELEVVGKGRNNGKLRFVTVSAEFVERWREHVRRHGLGPQDYMLYRRNWVTRTGQAADSEWQVKSKREACGDGALLTLFQHIAMAMAEVAGSLEEEAKLDFKPDPKVMRKTYACTQLILHHLGKGGQDITMLAKNLGHSDIRTTRIYLPDVEEYLSRLTTHVATSDAVDTIVEEVKRRESAEQEAQRLAKIQELERSLAELRAG